MRARLCVTLGASLLFVCAGQSRADGEADARKVIDRAIKAHGGADKINNFKAATFKLKGKFYGMSDDGTDYTGEFALQGRDKMRFEINAEAGGMTFKFVQVINGDKGWVQAMGNTQEMDKDALAEAKEGMYAGRVTALAGLADKGFKFAPLGEVKVGDRPAIGVRVSHKGHRDINLFFDKKTNKLLKRERRAKDEMSGQEFTEVELYDGYKEIGGVQHPLKLTVLRDDKKYVVGGSSDYTLQDKLDDSTFAKP